MAGDLDDFANGTWGRRALLSRAADLPGSATELFGPEAVDELIADRALRTPFLRVARDGTTLGDKEFTAGGGVGAGITDQLSDDKLLRLFADGSTMVLQALHRTWPPVVGFSQALAAELGHPVQVNAYVTPAQSRGFSDHYDVHDVFVMQVQGEKRWRIRPPVHTSPLRDEPWTARRAAVEAAAQQEPLLDAVLRPGDVLYLPRGFLHAATALGGVSTHLTVGIHTWTAHGVAQQLLDQALASMAADVDVRSSLRLGVDVADEASIEHVVNTVRAALVEALGSVTAADVARRLDRAASGAQRAAPLRPLAQLEAAQSVDAGTVVAVRPHVRARLLRRDDGWVVVSRAGELRLDDAELPCVQTLLEGREIEGRVVGDLPAGEGTTETVRRLLLAGVLVVR